MGIEASVQAVRAPEGERVRRIGIAMNGVTGRMGMNQHLIRSILAIREQGGVEVGREVIWPEPLLVGRDERKLARLAAAHGLDRYTTDLDAALADPGIDVYFDAQVTKRRPQAIRRAIAAGKHLYCEKPVTETLDEGIELARLARAAGVKNGVVQDKLFLPGLLKLRELIDTGFFGRILSVRGEFGYWVFPGPVPAPQRPSWNYRKEDGGGILVDMFCHWRYVLDNLFGPVRSVSALGAIHIPERIGEDGEPYAVTAEDAAYATFEIENGPVVQMNSSWCVRVDRDELFELQVDGTEGSAVAGLRECRIQPAAATPMPVWNPDIASPIDHRASWQRVPDRGEHDNGFKVQWERYLRHVAYDEPFPWDFLEAAKGIQLAELAMRSWAERRVVDVPELVL
jgi:predicted dehydrogenase